jgi:hypothetical protein
MKQEMAKDGTLANMYVQMREQKAVDRLLAQAQVEEVDVARGEEPKGEQPKGEEPAAPESGQQ